MHRNRKGRGSKAGRVFPLGSENSRRVAVLVPNKRQREDQSGGGAAKRHRTQEVPGGAVNNDERDEKGLELADTLCETALGAADAEIFFGTVIKISAQSSDQQARTNEESDVEHVVDDLAEVFNEASYYGFIRLNSSSQQIIFYSDRVCSDFRIRLQKNDVVEVRVSKRSLQLAEVSGSTKKAKADYVRVTRYSFEKNVGVEDMSNHDDPPLDDSTPPTRGLSFLSCDDTPVKKNLQAKMASKAFWELCGDEAAVLLLHGFDVRKKYFSVSSSGQIRASMITAMKVGNSTNSSEQGSSVLGMLARIQDRFLMPPRKREAESYIADMEAVGRQRWNPKMSDFERRVCFFLRVLLVPSINICSGELFSNLQKDMEGIVKPLVVLCVQKSSTLWEGFAKPILAALRTNFVASLVEERLSDCEPVKRYLQARVATLSEHLISLLVNQRTHEAGGDSGDSFSSERNGWQHMVNKPSVREMKQAQTLFDDLHEARVQKNRPYDDLEHYMRVYTQLYRVETYSGLTASVEKMVSGAPLTFHDSKAYYGQIKGLYLCKGRLGLVLSVEPQFHLYDKESPTFKQSWTNHALQVGKLLALSFDGKFARQENLLYLTSGICDKTQLSRNGMFVGFLINDWNSALPPDSGSSSLKQKSIAVLRDVLARHEGASFSLVECPSFYPACGPVLEALASRSSLPFENIVVSCRFNDIQSALVSNDHRNDLDEVQSKIKLRQFSRELVMKVQLGSQSALGAPFMTVDAYLAEVGNPVSSLRLESELHLEQLTALAHMLESKVAVVVGAPGTGKSFIAVRLVRILRQLEPDAKVLALSYKNHATDEFALDVLNAEIPIVRVGGRCKDERLRDYTLAAILKRDDNELGEDTESKQSRIDVNRCEEQLEEALRKRNAAAFCNWVALASCITIEQLIYFLMHYNPLLRSRESAADAKSIELSLIPCLRQLAHELHPKRFTLAELVRIESGTMTVDSHIADLIRRALGDCIHRILRIFKDAFDNWLPDRKLHSQLQQAKPQHSSGHAFTVPLANAGVGTGTAPDEYQNPEDDESDIDEERLNQQELFQHAFGTAYSDKAIQTKRIIPFGLESTSSGSIPFVPQIANCGELQNDQSKPRLLQTVNIWSLSSESRCRFIHTAVGSCLEEIDIEIGESQRKMDAAVHLNKLAQDKRKVFALTRRRQIGHWALSPKGNRFFQSSGEAQVPVVAMTIDGASIQANVVQDCDFDYVFVEEAAEQIEAKLAACLPKSAKGLYLIGDPDQLPPKPEVYQLAEHYAFGTSMMERLIANDFPASKMMCQSRMHPDISSYSIKLYPQLKNFLPSVSGLEKFAGFPNRVHFWDTGPINAEKKGTSITNVEEALRAICVAQFLMLNQVDPGRIGILTTYRGQARQIRDLVKSQASEKVGIEKFFASLWSDESSPFVKKATIKRMFEKIQWQDPKRGRIEDYDEEARAAEVKYTAFDEIAIDTVDNFQGDQKDFIVACFTRSNATHRCGFLKTNEGSQRLNVMLTRSRCLLFLIGDRECLEYDFKTKGRDPITRERVYDATDKYHNLVFKDLFTRLDNNQAASMELQVRCPRHPDFKAVCKSITCFEVGRFQCSTTCGKIRPSCGHECQQKCHAGICQSMCEVPVIFNCRSNASHPSWNAPCWQSASQRCPVVCEFECSRCSDTRLFEHIYRGRDGQSIHLRNGQLVRRQSEVRKTMLWRMCWQQESQIRCSERFSYMCVDSAHRHERSCGEDEKPCMKRTTRKLPCGHPSMKTCWERFCDDKSSSSVPDETCRHLVKEVCTSCSLGEVERVCSERHPKTPCMQLVDHMCRVCHQVGSRMCSTLADDYLCRAQVSERCETCASWGTKACGQALICKELFQEHCPKCGREGHRQCGMQFKCPKRKLTCSNCNKLLRFYTCEEGPPRTPPVCTGIAPHKCSFCGHFGNKPCALSETDFTCLAPCSKRLAKCQHVCSRECGLPCPTNEEECRECAMGRTRAWLLRDSLVERNSFMPGQRVLIPIWKLEFTQASCSLKMRSGRSLDELKREILLHHPERLLPDNFEKSYATLKVFVWVETRDGKTRVHFMSLDNRRLALLKKCRPGGEVYVTISDDKRDFDRKHEPEERRKLEPDKIENRDRKPRKRASDVVSDFARVVRSK